MTVEDSSPGPVSQDAKFPWTRILPFMVYSQTSSILWQTFNSLLTMLALELGQIVFRWLWARFSFSLHITATFLQEDATYEWLMFYLAERDVWRESAKNLVISAVNGKHQAEFDAFTDPGFKLDNIANCTPASDHVQRFCWRGYWAEAELTQPEGMYGDRPCARLKLSLYTRKTSVLQELVKEAHEAYRARGKKSVIVRSVKMGRFHELGWATSKTTVPRSAKSVIVDDGAVASLVEDVRRFLASEAWYHAKGVPYHRGYLLHGPPGSGKTSTVVSIAGEFGLPIYSISCSGKNVSDVSLTDLFSSIPKYAIVVMEDIDCVLPPSFANRDGSDIVLDPNGLPIPSFGEQSSMVTLSGLLNILDGVGSENGRIIFATTNYLEKLDPALRRPGRFDRTIRYNLATQNQACQLFLHLFSNPTIDAVKGEPHPEELVNLAKAFSSALPEHVFSMAELQGYLISHRDNCQAAVDDIAAWIERETSEKERLETYRSEKLKAALSRRDSYSMPPKFMPPSFGHPAFGPSMMETVDSEGSKDEASIGTLVSEPNHSILGSPAHVSMDIVPLTDKDEKCADGKDTGNRIPGA